MVLFKNSFVVLALAATSALASPLVERETVCFVIISYATLPVA